MTSTWWITSNCSAFLAVYWGCVPTCPVACNHHRISTHIWRNWLFRPTVSTASATVLEPCWLECVLKLVKYTCTQNKTKLGTVVLTCAKLKVTFPTVFTTSMCTVWYSLYFVNIDWTYQDTRATPSQLYEPPTFHTNSSLCGLQFSNLYMPSFTQELGISMTHIESRPSKTNPGAEYDFYADYSCTEEQRTELIKKLNDYTTSINVLSRTPQKDEGTWVRDMEVLFGLEEIWGDLASKLTTFHKKQIKQFCCAFTGGSQVCIAITWYLHVWGDATHSPFSAQDWNWSLCTYVHDPSPTMPWKKGIWVHMHAPAYGYRLVHRIIWVGPARYTSTTVSIERFHRSVSTRPPLKIEDICLKKKLSKI